MNNRTKINYFAIFLIILPNMIYAYLDNRVWIWDQAWYAEVTIDLWWKLIHASEKWLAGLTDAFRYKAPGIAWIGEFFILPGQAVKNTEFGLLLSIIFTQAAALWIIYLLIKKLFNKREMPAIASIIFIGSTPLFIGMSHNYFVESLQLLGVAYVYLIAAYCKEWSGIKILANLLFAISIAMLAKVTSPLYCLIPGIICCYYAKKNKFYSSGIDSVLTQAFLVPAILIFLMTTAWYIKNIKFFTIFALKASSGEVALYYGRAGNFFDKLLFWLNRISANLLYSSSKLIFLFVLIILAVTIIIGYLWKKEKTLNIEYNDIIAFTALLHLIGFVIILSLSINEESRYLLPTLVMFAIIFAWMLDRISSKILNIIVICIFVNVFINVQLQSYGLVRKDDKISKWINVYDSESALQKQVENVVINTCGKDIKDRISICGVDYWWLNANTLSFYSSKLHDSIGSKCQYQSVGHAQKDIKKAIKKIDDFKSPYFISVIEEKQKKPPDFLNKASANLLDWISHNRTFTPTFEDKNTGIIIYKRIGT